MTSEEAKQQVARFWGGATIMPGAARVSAVHHYPDDPHEGPAEFGLSLEGREWEAIAWSTRAADLFYSLLVQQEAED